MKSFQMLDDDESESYTIGVSRNKPIVKVNRDLMGEKYIFKKTNLESIWNQEAGITQ